MSNKPDFINHNTSFDYDFVPDTNLSKLQNMNIDEFAEWLDKNGQFDGSPWTNWFDSIHCKKCESIICKDEYGNEHEFAYCEINDHCEFFPNWGDAPNNKDIIKMWLGQNVN